MEVAEMCKCKKCQSSEYTKAGFVKGEQRYKCKKCGCQFVPTRHKGRSEEEKREAVKLYSHGLSFRAIAKLLKVSAQSVFVWVKNFAENNYAKPTPTDDGVVIELDEMWHFLRSKKDKFGFGKLTAGQQSNLSTGNVELEARILSKKCTID